MYFAIQPLGCNIISINKGVHAASGTISAKRALIYLLPYIMITSIIDRLNQRLDRIQRYTSTSSLCVDSFAKTAPRSSCLLLLRRLDRNCIADKSKRIKKLK